MDQIMYPQSNKAKKIYIYCKFTVESYTTAVDDIERKHPTNKPSDSFAPHNCSSIHTMKLR